MDDFPPSDAPLAPRAGERAPALYASRQPAWAERVTAREFLAASPALARVVRAAEEPPARTPRDWLARLALPGAVAALIAALLIGGDWKIEHFWREPAAGEDPARTLPVAPLARAAMPAGARAPIQEINDLLAAKPVEWKTVLLRAEALRGSDAGKGNPALHPWLAEVLVGAHLELAEREPHRLAHYEAVVRLDRELGPPEVQRPYAVAFGAAVALFECAGGSRDLYIGQGNARPAAELFDALARVRTGYPAELARSREQQRQLARIECYTLLRQLPPRRVWWPSHAPFDESDPANRETWTRLARGMAAWKSLEGERPSADLDQLQRVFWQAIDDFCSWPTRWRDDFVTIGNQTYRRAEARAALAEVQARQRQP
jgi:hypothetical protein